MMLVKYFILILCYAYCVWSVSSFIEQGQRAQLFELTDNVVATFKITIPEEDFPLLKEKAIANYDYEMTLGRSKVNVEMFLNALKGVNFYKVYPGYDVNKLLPDLKIDEDGFSQIDVRNIMDGCDFNPEHYNLKDGGSVFFKALASNPEINLLNVLATVSSMKMAKNAKVLSFFQYMINYYNSGVKQMPNIFRRGEDDNDSFDFKVKNATLVVDINGDKKSFEKVTFKMAGNNSRLYGKPAYNLKIHDDNLYGRKQFKLRADGSEPTYLRTKLVSDIHDRLGIPSISTNYITLYINNKYMGLYLLIDAFKPSWIEKSYGDADTSSLYQCEYLFDFNPAYTDSCFNENKDVEDDSDLFQFLHDVYRAKSSADLENIFEIDHFLTEMAIDYLLGSWDHVHNPTTGHNFYLYKKKNGKWIYLSYDFDLDFGIPRDGYISISFEQFTKQLNIIDVLILKDPTRFEKILKYVVDKVFNPAILFPHIDELKNFIKPYVKADKTPDENGEYPGRLNTKATDLYSLEVWDAASEFTRVKTKYNYTYGLKYWILYRYRFVCRYYEMKCDPTYIDESYTFPVNKNVEYKSAIPVPPPPPPHVSRPDSSNVSTSTGSTESTSSVPISSSTKSSSIQCWAQLVGYGCCPEGTNDVYYEDSYGKWGIDLKKEDWCGITPYKEPTQDKVCWSKELGFPCCKGCLVIDKDEFGSWGFELDHWCGIQSYCKK
ncbi:hypothetical protein BCR32DRAFT_235796 [Anaeromyces robustus]|uniref:CBM10 domain-containing protein n=1 Tax=Anaeromyces robustus TaxID=1754192 RepID=A0A1Y1WVA5_9FUNG|nr:hypothetical protein BCR32DRAFT_235796 [Anaeromyces robustus]|eukprot:ORX77392.1 hypothetical protein BCR32DRAFT_235796 [Anaeromyces robustus]